MKLKLAAALVASTAAITMLAGCPAVNTPDTGNEFKFSSDALITGKVLYDNKALNFADANYKHEISAKDAETKTVSSTKASVQDGMYFQFIEGLTAGKSYQLISDYKGTEPSKAEDVNMIRQFVTGPVKAEKGVTPPMTTIDLKWVLNPTVGYGAEATKSQAVTFKVDKIVNLDAEYQLRVVKVSASGESEAYVAPAYVANPEFSWTPDATGSYKYHVRFKKAGKTTYDGTDAFFGDSFKIPFTVK